jgi:hypothetical protein
MLNILSNDYTDGVVPVDLPLESVQLLRQDEDQNRGQLKGKKQATTPFLNPDLHVLIFGLACSNHL